MKFVGSARARPRADKMPGRKGSLGLNAAWHLCRSFLGNVVSGNLPDHHLHSSTRQATYCQWFSALSCLPSYITPDACSRETLLPLPFAWVAVDRLRSRSLGVGKLEDLPNAVIPSGTTPVIMHVKLSFAPWPVCGSTCGAFSDGWRADLDAASGHELRNALADARRGHASGGSPKRGQFHWSMLGPRSQEHQVSKRR